MTVYGASRSEMLWMCSVWSQEAEMRSWCAGE